MENQLTNIVLIQPSGSEALLFAFIRETYKPIQKETTMAQEVKELPSFYTIIAKMSVDKKKQIQVVKGHHIFLKKGVKLHFSYMSKKEDFATVEKFELDYVKTNLYVHMDFDGKKTRILFSKLDRAINWTYYLEPQQLPFQNFPMLSYNDLINTFDLLTEEEKDKIYSLVMTKVRTLY